MGSYMEHITTNEETAKDRLMKGLDSFNGIRIGPCSAWPPDLPPPPLDGS